MLSFVDEKIEEVDDGKETMWELFRSQLKIMDFVFKITKLTRIKKPELSAFGPEDFQNLVITFTQKGLFHKNTVEKMVTFLRITKIKIFGG